MAEGEQKSKGQLCKYCNKSVSNSVKCINCANIFHPSCAGRVKGVKTINSLEVICCSDSNSKNSVSDKGVSDGVLTEFTEQENYLKRENKMLMEMLSAKDDIINALREEIDLLKDKIVLMDEIKVLKQKSNEGKKTCDKKSAGISYQKEKNESDRKVNINNPSLITTDLMQQTLKKVNKEMTAHKQAEIMEDIINLQKNEKSIVDGDRLELEQHRSKKRSTPANDMTDCDNGFITYSSRKNRRRNAIVGSKATTNDDVGFSGVERKAWLYIGRTAKTTTEQTVISYLKMNFKDEEFNVTKLTSKSEYPCFKIGASFKLKDKLNSSDLWPVGVVVRRYNFRSNDFFVKNADKDKGTN